MILNQGAPKALLNNTGEKGLHRVILTGERGQEDCSMPRDSHSWLGAWLKRAL